MKISASFTTLEKLQNSLQRWIEIQCIKEVLRLETLKVAKMVDINKNNNKCVSCFWKVTYYTAAVSPPSDILALSKESNMDAISL